MTPLDLELLILENDNGNPAGVKSAKQLSQTDREMNRPTGPNNNTGTYVHKSITQGVTGKGQILDIALLHDEHMLSSAFAVSEVAADWH